MPDGVTLRDASEILPRSFLSREGIKGRHALLSDYFRFRLLLDRGGWWVDLDVVCLEPFAFPQEYVFASEVSPQGPHPASCVIKSPPGAPYLRAAVEKLEALDPHNIQWGEAGPGLIAAGIGAYSLQQWVQPPDVFCPLDPPDWESILDPNFSGRFPERTRAVHFWHELWRRGRRDTNARFPRASLYERLKRENGMEEDSRTLLRRALSFTRG